MADRYSERAGGRWDEGDWRLRERDYRDSDRTFLERFADEVRSWFGDEEAQRRRMRDEREDWRGRSDWRSREWSRGDWRRGDWDRSEAGRSGRGDWMRGPDDREWSRDWGYVEGRPQSAGRGHDAGSFGTTGYGGYGAWGRDRDWNQEPRVRPSREWASRPGMSGFGGGEPTSRWRESPTRSYAGRGPRNYQRTDERIREDICERLTQHSELDPSDVDVRVQNGEVTLDGTVDDRWAKRTVEDLAEGVWGVKSVHNMIRVVATEPGPDYRRAEQREPGPAEQGRPHRGTWAA